MQITGGQANQIQKLTAEFQIEKPPATYRLIEDTDKKTPLTQATQSMPLAGWITIMSETFEGTFPSAGWQVFDGDGTTNGEYYWDDDDYKPHQGAKSAWCAKGGANGVDPQYYYYPGNCKSWMIYGPFSLRDVFDAELLFYYWNSSEPDSDRFFWGASKNGSNFYGYRVSGNSGGWQYINFDLTNVYTLGNLCGKDSVWICFYFQSNGSNNNYDGAFVDDIVLQKSTTAKPDLVITRITPSNSNPTKNDYINVTVVVKNRGSVSSTSSYVGLYYNLPSPPDVNTWRDAYMTVFGLSPGDTDVVVFPGITSPYATTWNMYALADCFGSIEETDETNNYAGPQVIQWREPSPMPDLVFTTVTPSSVTPGVAKYDYLYTDVTVYNSGNASAGAFWTDIFYNATSPPVAPAYGDDYRYTYSLPAGSSNTFTFVTRNKAGNAESWDDYLLVDSNNLIHEQNENNNLNGPAHISWTVMTHYPQRTRDQIINTAAEFVNAFWQPSANNLYPPGECPNWRIDPLNNPGYPIAGEAYEWGAWDRPNDFLKLLNLQYNSAAFFKPGYRESLYCEAGGDPFWAIGADCSGLVSRAWNLSYNCGTKCLNLPVVSESLFSYQYLLRGDIVDWPDTHVAIFYEWGNYDTMWVIEETPPRARLVKWPLQKYSPRYKPYRYKYVAGVPDIAGDANSDGIVSVGDIIWLINFLFKGGPAPVPCWKGDVNADCRVTVSDVVYLVNYLFKGGPVPLRGCAVC